jgi:hypothetical protein
VSAPVAVVTVEYVPAGQAVQVSASFGEKAPAGQASTHTEVSFKGVRMTCWKAGTRVLSVNSLKPVDALGTKNTASVCCPDVCAIAVDSRRNQRIPTRETG